MLETVMFLIHDAKKGWDELRPIDFAQPSLFGIWSMILMMSLVGIDRRDALTGLVYALFCVAAGAMLVFALPMTLVPPSDLGTMVSTLTIMAALAGIRWLYKLNGALHGKSKKG